MVGDLWNTVLADQATIHTLESEGRRDLPQILLGLSCYIVLVLFVRVYVVAFGILDALFTRRFTNGFVAGFLGERSHFFYVG